MGIDRLAGVPGAKLGRGPLHPVAPDASIAPRIESFIDLYPALRRDAGYVRFLREYSGASIENDDYSVLVDVYGFTDASIDMYDTDEGDLVVDGFLAFAQCVYHVDTPEKPDTYEYDFAFDVTGARPSGVYRSYSGMYEADRPFALYLGSFDEWLAELIANQGRYARMPEVR